jgi:hypothetical protein
MKKLSTYLACALFMAVVFSSCSSRPEDINVADLKEPCDFVDAAVQVLDAIIEITYDVKSPEGFIQGTGALMNQLSEDDKKRGQALGKKIDEIFEEFDEKFGRNFKPDCPNFKAFQEKMWKFQEKVGRFNRFQLLFQ